MGPYLHNQVVKSECEGITNVLRRYTSGDCNWETRKCEVCDMLMDTPAKEHNVAHHWAYEQKSNIDWIQAAYRYARGQKAPHRPTDTEALLWAAFQQSQGEKPQQQDALISICEKLMGCVGDELGACSQDEVKNHPTLEAHSKIYDEAEKVIKRIKAASN